MRSFLVTRSTAEYAVDKTRNDVVFKFLFAENRFENRFYGELGSVERGEVDVEVGVVEVCSEQLTIILLVVKTAQRELYFDTSEVAEREVDQKFEFVRYGLIRINFQKYSESCVEYAREKRR